MKRILSVVAVMLLCSAMMFPIHAGAVGNQITSGETVHCNLDDSSESYTITVNGDSDMRVRLEKSEASPVYIKVTDSNGTPITPYNWSSWCYRDSNGNHYLQNGGTAGGTFAYHLKKGDYTIELSSRQSLVTATVWLSGRSNSAIISGEPIYDSIDWSSPKSYTIASSGDGDMTVEFEKDGDVMYIEVVDGNGTPVTPYEYSSDCNRNDNGYYYLKSSHDKGTFTYRVKKGNYTVSFSNPNDLCSLTATVTAPSAGLPSASGNSGNISVTVNGKAVNFDQPPIIVNDRTLVPVRAIFEVLGASVDWNNDTETVTSKRGNVTITLTIGSNIMYKNGTAITLDVPAQIVSDRTLVPVRAIAEAFDCNVDWNDNTQTVIITE